MFVCALLSGEVHNKPPGNVLIILTYEKNYLLSMLLFVLFCVMYFARTQHSLLHLVILTTNFLSNELIRFVTRSPRTTSIFLFCRKET